MERTRTYSWIDPHVLSRLSREMSEFEFTHYLRPVTGDIGPLRAIGTVINGGRRTALARGELRDAEDRLLAHGTSSCMVFPPGS